ncbi:MAG: hypothetical protein ABEJ62_01205 [Candidatus Nanohaloarchaea archaeon]
MRRKGFMYSIFAIFLIGLLVIIVSNPVRIGELDSRTPVSRIDETYYFLSSVQDDLERGTGIIAKRAFSTAINHVLSNVEPLERPEIALESAFLNGTINGSNQSLMQDSAFEDWRRAVVSKAQKSGWKLSVEIGNLGFGTSGPSKGFVNVTYRAELVDPSSDSSFRGNTSGSQGIVVTNMSDPLVYLETEGQYTRGFSRCDAGERAFRLSTGTEKFYENGRNWTSGEAVLRPGNGPLDGVDDRGDKVVLVDDVCAYTDPEISTVLSDFRGVVSGQEGGISADGSTICGDADSSGFNAYVGGASGSLESSNRTTVVMDEYQVWENNLRRELESGCYFRDPRGPTVLGRLEGDLTVGRGRATGWASFLFVPDLPSDFQDASRSSVGYVYFNDTAYGDNLQVKGVTNYYSWFKLDSYHVDLWNVSRLTYS